MGHGRSRHHASVIRKRLVLEALERRKDSRGNRDYKDVVRERIEELEELERDELPDLPPSMRGSHGRTQED